VPPANPTSQAVVVGAGISGLACAYHLRKLGLQVLVLEQSPRPGGLVRSVRRDGFLLEEGPQSFLLTAPMFEMIRELGLESELLRADPRAARYVLIEGKLTRVPLAPPQLLFGSLLGARTKWSLLRDALGRSIPPDGDESISDFVRRKFTPELLDRLVGPFVSGIYAGDPARLGLRATFPVIYELESKYGSIIRGAMKSRGERGGQRLGSISFRGGNETLMTALGKSLGESLLLDATVEAISTEPVAGKREFRFQVAHGGERVQFRSAAVVVTCPAATAANLLRPLSPGMAAALSAIEYAPVAMLYAGFPRAQVGHPLSGFGFLVPRAAARQLLGTVWNSSLFAGRSPEGSALFTSFAGGTTNPGFASADPEAIRDALLQELRPILDLRGAPAFWAVKTYPRAIPQYPPGHALEVAGLVETAARTLPGLLLAGNYLQGPSVGDCIASGQRAALAAAGYLRSLGA